MATVYETPDYKDPVIKPAILSRGTLLTNDIDRARQFYEEFLGLEVADHGEGRILARDTDPVALRQRKGNAYWVMDVTKADETVSTNLFKHWGIEVGTQAEVDRVQAYAEEHKDRLGLRTVRSPRIQHGTYSFYLEDFDGNWWEVEARPEVEDTEVVFARGDSDFQV